MHGELVRCQFDTIVAHAQRDGIKCVELRLDMLQRLRTIGCLFRKVVLLFVPPTLSAPAAISSAFMLAARRLATSIASMSCLAHQLGDFFGAMAALCKEV